MKRLFEPFDSHRFLFVFVSVRSSSTEHPSGGDAADLPGLYPDRDHRTRTYETPSTVSTTIESKTRREKINSKGQQDEEEERGKTDGEDERRSSVFGA